MNDRIWANRKTDGELYIGIDRIIDDKADRAECTIMCAEPPVFKIRRLFETDDLTAMCAITDEMAIELMDSLWRAGIRPKQRGRTMNDREFVEKLQIYLDQKYPGLIQCVEGVSRQLNIHVVTVPLQISWCIDMNESLGVVEDRILRALKDAKRLAQHQIDMIEGKHED